MAGKEIAKIASTPAWIKFVAIAVVALFIGGAFTYLYIPREEQVEVEVPVNVSMPVNTSEWVPIADHDALQETHDELLDEFADDIREGEVKAITMDAIDEDYIEDLDFDEEAFDDSTFELAYAGWNLDEDEGDYDVDVDFVIFEYNEDEELINTYNANATLEVQDDDDVKGLDIQFV